MCVYSLLSVYSLVIFYKVTENTELVDTELLFLGVKQS